MRTRIDASKLELTETIVNIRRVSKTVKGGKNMKFSVTLVVGDGAGHVGIGLGKAQEIPEAVRKATEDAKKKLIFVPSRNNSSSPDCRNFRSRQSFNHAFSRRYWSYRRFICTYSTRSLWTQGC